MPSAIPHPRSPRNPPNPRFRHFPPHRFSACACCLHADRSQKSLASMIGKGISIADIFHHSCRIAMAGGRSVFKNNDPVIVRREFIWKSLPAVVENLFKLDDLPKQISVVLSEDVKQLDISQQLLRINTDVFLKQFAKCRQYSQDFATVFGAFGIE